MIKLTFFSVCMAVIWSSFFIVLFCIMRKNHRFLGIVSIPGVGFFCLLCILRLFVSIEVQGAVVVPAELMYNGIYKRLQTVIISYDNYEISVMHLLIFFWIIGAFAFFFFDIVEIYKTQRWVSRLSLYFFEEQENIKKKALRGAENRIKIYIDPDISEPVCCGLINRCIVLPGRRYPDKMLYFILRHEYMHLKNGDIMIKHMIYFLCAFFWWNPFVYLLRRNFDHIFELRCDENVIRDMEDSEKADYLEAILDVYKDKCRNAKTVSRNLRERFDHVKYYRQNGKHNVYFACASMLLLYVLSYTFIFQSKYNPVLPEEEGAVFYSADDLMHRAYLLKKSEGIYALVVDGEEYDVSNKGAEVLIQNGIEIIKGEKDNE